MIKLYRYIKQHIFYIFQTLLISTAFAFGGYPYLSHKLSFSRELLLETDINTLISLTLIVLFFLVLFFRRCKEYWSKYKKTYSLKRPPFLYLDGLVLFLFLVVSEVYFLHSAPKVSTAFIYFAAINASIVSIWLLSIYLLPVGAQRYIDKVKSIKETEDFFFSDKPIDSFDQDIFRRESFVETFYNEINDMPFSDSFVFGLNAKWGEGKTSVLKLLLKTFDQKGNDSFIQIYFDPWHFKDSDAILVAFYNQLEVSIRKDYLIPNLKKDLYRYLRLILSGTVPLSGITLGVSLKNNLPIKELKDRIEYSLRITKKKLLVVIDDIDRLSPSEVLQIFKLVRLNANFSNTIFILSYDTNIIREYLSKEKFDSKYIEKIVEKEIPLPLITQESIRTYLFNNIYKFFDKIKLPDKKKEAFKKDIEYLYRANICRFFTTLRDAKRFLNSFYTTLTPVASEVNLSDFFILEVIKTVFPKVYEDLRTSYWVYIKQGLYEFGDDNVIYAKVKAHVDNVIKDQKNKEELQGLLEKLFIRVKKAYGGGSGYADISDSDRTNKRVMHPDCFSKYFTLKVPENELPDGYVETTITSLVEVEVKGRFSDLKKVAEALKERGKLGEYFQKVSILKRDDLHEEVASVFIEYISKNSEKFDRGATYESHFYSEYTSALRLLIELVGSKSDKQEIQHILEEIISTTSDKQLLVMLVYDSIKDTNFDISTNVDKESLVQCAYECLNKYYVTKERDIFDELANKEIFAKVFYGWVGFAGYKEENKEDNKVVISNYILSLVKKDVRKLLQLLDVFLMVSAENPKKHFDFEYVKKTFDLSSLKEIVISYSDSTNVTLEEEQVQLLSQFLRELDEFEGKE